MNRSAHVTSIDSIRDFSVALAEFQEEVRAILVQLSLEQRRAEQWFEEDRPRYWPEQVRLAADAVIVARNDLERCQMATRPTERPSCLQQKKALDKAKRRLRLAEQKVDTARTWARTIGQEMDELTSQVAILTDHLDMQVPLAIAQLKRMTEALESYVRHSTQAVQSPPQRPEPNESSPGEPS